MSHLFVISISCQQDVGDAGRERSKGRKTVQEIKRGEGKREGKEVPSSRVFVFLACFVS